MHIPVRGCIQLLKLSPIHTRAPRAKRCDTAPTKKGRSRHKCAQLYIHSIDSCTVFNNRNRRIYLQLYHCTTMQLYNSAAIQLYTNNCHIAYKSKSAINLWKLYIHPFDRCVVVQFPAFLVAKTMQVYNYTSIELYNYTSVKWMYSTCTY